jgi:hypothetical protein
MEDGAWGGDVEDAELEWKLCAGALPAMLAAALVLHSFELGHFLQRTFLAMPVHELGHAATAWLCGYAAIPTLWKTHVPEARGLLMPVLVIGGMAFLGWRTWKSEAYALVAVAAVVIALQLAGTFGIKPQTARMLVTFGGDGMGMVIAAALMTTFFYGKDTQLYKGGLRWGFLAIGAGAYVDLFATWVAARRDHGRIPFGEQEGGMHSDATVLVDDYDWSTGMLTGRYLALGVCCLLVVLAVWAWGVWRARQAAAG